MGDKTNPFAWYDLNPGENVTGFDFWGDLRKVSGFVPEWSMN